MIQSAAFSSASLKKLGGRLRDIDSSKEDLERLDAYVFTFDSALLRTAAGVADRLASSQPPSLLSGRIKRSKSIIRKLVREPTMDLSRMTDIAGLRILALDVAAQDEICRRLADVVQAPRLRDYRDADLESGRLYRAIHITGKADDHFVEIQVRTLPQHLWATESESLGERAKEGSYIDEEAAYLLELAYAVRELDLGQSPETLSLKSSMAQSRSPLTFRFSRMRSGFQAAISTTQDDPASTYLIIHDQVTNEIIQRYHYMPSHRDEALAEFRRLSTEMDLNRFNVLVLNSSTAEALEITHPRFFGF